MEIVFMFTMCLAVAAIGVTVYDYWKMKKDDKKF